MNYLIILLILFFVGVPGWLIAFLLYRISKNFNVVFNVDTKRKSFEKKAAVPEAIFEPDLGDINERLDKALALRQTDDAVESHVQNLGKETVLEHEDSEAAVNKLRNIGSKF